MIPIGHIIAAAAKAAAAKSAHAVQAGANHPLQTMAQAGGAASGAKALKDLVSKDARREPEYDVIVVETEYYYDE